MDLTAITLTELRYIVAVADTGHFGRAAADCHVSQPTLSTQIKKLEDQLGVSIFERTSKRVRLTAAGERIVERARVILEMGPRAARAVRAPRRRWPGSLRAPALENGGRIRRRIVPACRSFRSIRCGVLCATESR